jgi:hypothetical protein
MSKKKPHQGAKAQRRKGAKNQTRNILYQLQYSLSILKGYTLSKQKKIKGISKKKPHQGVKDHTVIYPNSRCQLQW